MPTLADALRVNDAFFQPLAGLVATSPHTYPCPEFSDEDWVHLGIQRVLERVESGAPSFRNTARALIINRPAPTISSPKGVSAAAIWPAT